MVTTTTTTTTMARLLVTSLLLLATHAFVPLDPTTTSIAIRKHVRQASRLCNSNSNHHNNNPKPFFDNSVRTDISHFLTQRAFQSFFFLLHSCRDPHTITWLEDTYGWTNLENFHGTGFFNLTVYPSWDTLLFDLMSQPPGVVVVRAKRRGRGHGGWSKNNPHLQERFVEFDIDIDPVSLASRILAVREQIAAEWVHDLDTLVCMNDMIRQSYQDSTRIARDDNAPAQQRAFERNANFLIGNTNAMSGQSPSPLRKGNFDLLVLLATQESVHRVLRQYRDDDSVGSLEWLREFYISRIPSHFDGHQEYGRADDFLEELFLTLPSVKTKSDSDGKDQLDLTDPMKVAEDILLMRTQVAEDWKAIAGNVPAEHTGLRKALLDRQMEKWGQPQTPAAVEGEMGEFQ